MPWPPAAAQSRGGVASATAAAAASGDAAAAPKAALLIIGDEILKGSISDANTPWLAKLLYSRGVDLVRVECVPDEVDDIVASVRALRARVGDTGFVFTSGGERRACRPAARQLRVVRAALPTVLKHDQAV